MHINCMYCLMSSDGSLGLHWSRSASHLLYDICRACAYSICIWHIHQGSHRSTRLIIHRGNPWLGVMHSFSATKATLDFAKTMKCSLIAELRTCVILVIGWECCFVGMFTDFMALRQWYNSSFGAGPNARLHDSSITSRLPWWWLWRTLLTVLCILLKDNTLRFGTWLLLKPPMTCVTGHITPLLSAISRSRAVEIVSPCVFAPSNFKHWIPASQMHHIR